MSKDFYQTISKKKETWLVTGAAGFIGTNLCKTLLDLGQTVVAMDNFSLGKRENIDLLEKLGQKSSGSFDFYEGDIRKLEDCETVFNKNIDRVLHNAALGSIPRSIENPINSHNSNVTGFINMIWCAQKANVKRFVFASSSSVYGTDKSVPKVEHKIGKALAPYASTKHMNELYAEVFGRTYGIDVIGLRYFNVFGPHQRPEGPYAAVIPKWINLLLMGKQITIYGDGETTRDFCFVENVVQMNLRAATTDNPEAINQIYNVACQDQTSLNQLFNMIKENLAEKKPDLEVKDPDYTDFRAGDVRAAMADISKAKSLLGYEPSFDVGKGLKQSMDWYIEHHN